MGLLGCSGCKGCTTCGWLVYTPPPPPSPPPSLSVSVPVTLLRPSNDPPSLSESQLSVCLFRSLRVKADCRIDGRCSGGFHRQEPLPSVLGGFTTGLFDLDSGWASTRTILPDLSKPPPPTAPVVEAGGDGSWSVSARYRMDPVQLTVLPPSSDRGEWSRPCCLDKAITCMRRGCPPALSGLQGMVVFSATLSHFSLTDPPPSIILSSDSLS